MSVALVSAQSDRPAKQPKPSRSSQPQFTAQSANPSEFAAKRALIDQYCVVCHNAKAKTANLLLDELDLAHLADHAEIGEKLVRKLRAGMMPPTGMRRPDASAME